MNITLKTIFGIFVVVLACMFSSCRECQKCIPKDMVRDSLSVGIHHTDTVAFDFMLLYRGHDTLPYTEAGYYDKEPLYSRAIKNGTTTDTLKVYKLSADPEILFYDYPQDFDPAMNHLHDAVQISGSYFNMDSLHFHLHRHEPQSYCANVGLTAYIYHLKNTYVAIQYTDLNYNTSHPWNEILFFEIKEGRVSAVQYMMYHSAPSGLCFGDFDHDGTIDYAQISGDSVVCHTITAGGFKPMPGKYMRLMTDGWDYIVDTATLDRSHWF